MKSPLIFTCCLSLTFCLLLVSAMLAQNAPNATNAGEKFSQIDGGAGPCSLELTVTTPDGKPAYAASVKVHIPYRFGGFHKLDLEVGTDQQGKAKFTGLPSRVRRPPLEFDATLNGLSGIAAYDPGSECQAKHDLVLATPAPTASQ